MAKFFFVFLLFVFIFINSSYCNGPYEGPWKIDNTEEKRKIREKKEKEDKKWAEKISKANVKGKTRHDYDFIQN
uniref:Uncharacterized protein n=1 Tax=Meloidogyne enterolobii TaxID=390850 RepID=A0A6V7U570_MELEN|nr:unnamed protein product [Meloidogyne enterolobii]